MQNQFKNKISKTKRTRKFERILSSDWSIYFQASISLQVSTINKLHQKLHQNPEFAPEFSHFESGMDEPLTAESGVATLDSVENAERDSLERQKVK